jgi:flagellar basal body-associated protein FliL
MATTPSRPEKDNQENEPERSSRLYVLIILGIIVASLAIFIVLSHPTRQTSAPAHSFLIPIDQHS